MDDWWHSRFPKPEEARALRLAREHGVKVEKLEETWNWRIDALGAGGFATAYEAASAGLKALAQLIGEAA